MKIVQITRELKDRVQRAAPEHPPCFDSREGWLEWLALAQLSGEDAVVPFAAGRPRLFNRELNFCADCEMRREERMRMVGRCRPNWLIDGEDATAGRVHDDELESVG